VKKQPDRFTQAFLRVTEPIVFGRRCTTLIVVGLLTLFLGYHASLLERDAGYQKQLPQEHEFTQVFKKYQGVFGGTTRIFIAVIRKDDRDIYDPAFLRALQHATDDVFFLPGVDRPSVTSLFTPNVWFAESKEGGVLNAGTVVPADYQPTAEKTAEVRANVAKTSIHGQLISLDQRGAMIRAELLEFDPHTGAAIDLVEISDRLEDVRGRIMNPEMREYRLKVDYPPLKKGEVVARGYRSLRGPFGLEWDQAAYDISYINDAGLGSVLTVPIDDLEVSVVPNPDFQPHLDVHIIGFAKAVGDVSAAASEVVLLFGVTMVVILLLLWLYSGSIRIALLPLGCALIAVIWELGLLRLFGFGLDPYAILVPFLILALAVSHGVQITNLWLYEMTDHGHSGHDASRVTFRRLVIPGLTALLSDIAGFAMILLIPIALIQELALNACFGFAGIIVAKKILLPILLSYTTVSNLQPFREHQQRRDRLFDSLWAKVAAVTDRRNATIVLSLTALGFAWALWESQRLEIGEIYAQVPELKAESRYNLDAAAIGRSFARDRDAVLKVMAESHPDACIEHPVMEEIGRFAWHMANSEGVLGVRSLPQSAAYITGMLFEGNPKMRVLPRNRHLLVQSTGAAGPANGLANTDCSVMPVEIYLENQKAQTIERVISRVKQYQPESKSNVTFALASGNVGVTAASNEVIKGAHWKILLWVYLAVAACVWMSFQSVRAMLCILVPLMLVSVLTYAVMVQLGIGLKVTTLPIAAFAVGIGVDYGIYIYSVLEERMETGMPLRAAYQETLHQTGKAVVFTGFALAAGVGTWVLSDLQFQVEMGLLLAVMFIGNMFGAIFVLPALATMLDQRRDRQVWAAAQ
jgi:uncharacterized protein